MKKPGIPAIPKGLPNDHFTVLATIKENIELIGGARGTTISQLETTATLAEVIVALNKVIDRLSYG